MTDIAQDSGSNEIQGVRPEHLRVVSLRLEGKRWSEIANELGVTPWTIWHWRETFPHIDEMIAAESSDYLEATKHSLLKLLPKAAKALEQILDDPLHAKRHDAAKTTLELFRKGEKSGDMQPTAAVAAVTRHAKTLEALPDADIDSALSAAVVVAPRAKR